MKILNEPLLATYRVAGPCEWCKRWCRVREPHHIRCRGHGGGGRLDVPVNLVALGSSQMMCCSCHTDHHAMKEPTTEDLLAIACQREGILQDQAIELLDFLARCPKEMLGWQVTAAMDGMRGSAKALAKRTLAELRRRETA